MAARTALHTALHTAEHGGIQSARLWSEEYVRAHAGLRLMRYCPSDGSWRLLLGDWARRSSRQLACLGWRVCIAAAGGFDGVWPSAWGRV